MRTNKKLEHIEDENLRFALEHSRDEKAYPDIFPEDYGMDFHSEDHPEWYAKKKDPCEITLKISSYRGISFDAVHFYGEINIRHLNIVHKNESGKEVNHCGYLDNYVESLPENVKAAYSSCYVIEIVRVLTEEIINSDKERWDHYWPGCATDAFDTPEEIIDIAKKIVTTRIPWFNIDDLKIDHDYYDVDVRRYR